jgi:hypothetical protein
MRRSPALRATGVLARSIACQESCRMTHARSMNSFLRPKSYIPKCSSTTGRRGRLKPPPPTVIVGYTGFHATLHFRDLKVGDDELH